jgi:hypothetical protein
MSLQYFEEKKDIFKIVLSFYLKIVCKNIVCDEGLTLTPSYIFELKVSQDINGVLK